MNWTGIYEWTHELKGLEYDWQMKISETYSTCYDDIWMNFTIEQLDDRGMREGFELLKD